MAQTSRASLEAHPVAGSLASPPVTVFADLMELRSTGEGVFIAPRAPEDGARTYGGQFLAHTLRAAQLTVDDDRFVHSTHSYFLRSGDTSAETTLEVDRVRDGRSFSQRQVTAWQDGKEMFRTLISFHVAEDGLDWAPPVSISSVGPDDVAESYHDFWESLMASEELPWGGRDRPMDIRYVNTPNAPEGTSITEPQLMWMRLRERLEAGRNLHDVGLAYLADATLVDHVMLPHGFRWQDPRLTGASLDHAMWFHRPVRADDWLFYDQRVESTGGARGLASGRFFTPDGTLVATCMQEGLMRWAA